MYNKEIKLGTGLLSHKYKYFYDPTHPLALTNGCVYYHRHLVSMREGRWLNADEHVHHIDDNSLNNELSNLQILSRSEHTRVHRAAEYLIQKCLFCSSDIHTTIKENKLYCSSACAQKYRIKDKNITKSILDELIPKHSWTELGEMFGYSDNGIKKRAKTLGCDITKAKYSRKKLT